mmetsp:Transcript_70701/g.153526  ORF Transcript_70701/g.153526 Transcript_70701/m.153526 type:complete len:149 (+) Transcript_70701:3335-3781(+)
MLDSDLCLAYTDGQGELLQAASDDCCAWQDTINEDFSMEAMLAQDDDMLCGVKCGTVLPNGRTLECHRYKHFGQGGMEAQLCCALETERTDCGTPGHGKVRTGGPAVHEAKSFADDESVWQSEFLKAWQIATGNGFPNLQALQPSCEA